MLSFFQSKWSKKTPQPKPHDPFPHKDPSCLNVLVPTYWQSLSVAPAPFTLLKDEQEKASIASNRFLREIETQTLTIPGYQLMAMDPESRNFSRMRNLKAEQWRSKALNTADAFLYFVDVAGRSDVYLDPPKNLAFVSQESYWEGDRMQISFFLTNPALLENPKKPLVLLVRTQEEEDLDVERLSNLLGLARLSRPFHALSYTDADSDPVKEALEFLKASAHSKDDESTAAMTGTDTEEEGSVVTAYTTMTGTAATQAGHYILDYEPTLLGGNATLQRFEPIKKGTHCPFARSAKLWGGKLRDETQPHFGRRNMAPAKEAAALNAGPLAEFVARVKDGQPLDGFCLEIPGGSYCHVDYLGQLVHELLNQLAELNPVPGENSMKGKVDSPRWRFRFAGEDFFLTTFSPAYEEDSSRFAFGVKQAFLLFQPMTSFGRQGLVEDTPASATNWDNPTTMRDKARVAFKKNGCPYHIPEELPYPVAEHVVKPLKDDGTASVRWWEPLEDKKESGAAGWG